MAIARIQTELARLPLDLKVFEEMIQSLSPINDDLFHWLGIIKGPDGSPYQGGLFELDITIPKQYPYKGPKVLFKTPIFHPNICANDGTICHLSLGDGWSPAYLIIEICIFIQILLQEPDWPNFMVPAIASMSRPDFFMTAESWTRQVMDRTWDKRKVPKAFLENNYLGLKSASSTDFGFLDTLPLL